MKQSHSLSALLYAISNGIERASFYGIRSLLILYMIGETLQMTHAEALSFYGWLTMSFYISKVIGALLGDLLLGNRTAILIGGLLQVIGCILLCFETQTFLYMSATFLVIGNGLFSPNVLGQFGKQYSDKPKIIDSGFTGYFFFINMGSFLGILTISFLGDINFSYGFIFGGVLMLLSTLLAYFTKGNTPLIDSKNRVYSTDLIKKIVFICIAIILAGVFWACYEFYFGRTTYYWSQTDLDYSLLNTITSSSGIIFTLILAIIWTFVYTNQFSKFCVGLIISALAVSLLISLPDNPAEAGSMVLIVSGILLALGEAFIAPMLFAITTRYTNPKYLAIVLSLVSLPIMIFFKIAGIISELTFEYDRSGIFIAVTSILVLFGVIAFGLWFVQKSDDSKLSAQNEIIE